MPGWACCCWHLGPHGWHPDARSGPQSGDRRSGKGTPERQAWAKNSHKTRTRRTKGLAVVPLTLCFCNSPGRTRTSDHSVNSQYCPLLTVRLAPKSPIIPNSDLSQTAGRGRISRPFRNENRSQIGPSSGEPFTVAAARSPCVRQPCWLVASAAPPRAPVLHAVRHPT